MKNIIIISLLLGVFIFLLPPYKNTYARVQTIEEKLSVIFGKDSKIGIATIKHESQGFKLNAKNWNCIYEGKSTFCKKQDRDKAWSVDCGLTQKNVKGKVCPKELMTLEGGLIEIKKVYNEQGLNAWVSFKTGAYKKFL
jgi:hypothetical protein